MRNRLIRIWQVLSESYWFVPLLMAAAAVTLCEVLLRVSAAGSADWVRDVDWLYLNQPEGARALLSTVAGSMITVAGVTFSMTILAISHASSQYGPRLFSDFMRDRGNQITLGTYIATFIYCILVLRSVRAGDPTSALEAFVPQLAVMVGLGLAIASVLVLIYFIHHVPETLSVSTLIDRVARTLHGRIEALYPTSIGEDASRESPWESAESARIALRADTELGYLQYVDAEALIAIATELGAVIELRRRPGEFVSCRTELALVHGTDALPEPLEERLRHAFVCGLERTPLQDVTFPALQIVEIAVRALSPGTNDPFTAIRCIDRLGAAITFFGQRALPTARRNDAEGELRIVAEPIRFEAFLDEVMDGLRAHVCCDDVCALHLVDTLARVADCLDDPDAIAALDRHRIGIAELAIDRSFDERTCTALRRHLASPA